MLALLCFALLWLLLICVAGRRGWCHFPQSHAAVAKWTPRRGERGEPHERRRKDGLQFHS